MKVVNVTGDDIKIGQIIKVLILSAKSFSLDGKKVN
jgi:hypothetical protein